VYGGVRQSAAFWLHGQFGCLGAATAAVLRQGILSARSSLLRFKCMTKCPQTLAGRHAFSLLCTPKTNPTGAEKAKRPAYPAGVSTWMLVSRSAFGVLASSPSSSVRPPAPSSKSSSRRRGLPGLRSFRQERLPSAWRSAFVLVRATFIVTPTRTFRMQHETESGTRPST